MQFPEGLEDSPFKWNIFSNFVFFSERLNFKSQNLSFFKTMPSFQFKRCCSFLWIQSPDLKLHNRYCYSAKPLDSEIINYNWSSKRKKKIEEDSPLLPHIWYHICTVNYVTYLAVEILSNSTLLTNLKRIWRFG